jgi:hypothetical protein
MHFSAMQLATLLTAESTISPDGSRVVFTSDMDGDLELYTMGSSTLSPDSICPNRIRFCISFFELQISMARMSSA